MTPQDQYHLLALSQAPIRDTGEAKLKGKALIELALRLEQKEKDEAAEKATEETE